MYKLFIGDDTNGDFGRKFYFTPVSELDLTGCIGQFTVAGITKTFTDMVSGEPQELVFTRAQTGSMKRGIHRATLAIYDSTGRHRTIANDILVKCTDVVEEVYSGIDNSIRFTIDCGVDWSGVSNKPSINGHTLFGNKTSSELGLQSQLTSQQLSNIEAVPNKANRTELCSAWAANTAYTTTSFVIHDNAIYRCTTAHTSGSAWDSSKWILATIADILALYLPLAGGGEIVGNLSVIGLLDIRNFIQAPLRLRVENWDSDHDLYSLEFGIFNDKWQFKFTRIGIDDPTVFYLALPFATGEIATTAAVINAVYPVGSIYVSVSPTSPATLFGVGTWERITGRFLLAATDDGESGAEQAAGNTGGEATHTLTSDEMPPHTHGSKSLTGSWSTEGWNGVGGSGIVSKASSNYNRKSPGSGNLLGNTKFNIDATHEHDSAGGGQAHNNMPPFLSVYMWKRTA